MTQCHVASSLPLLLLHPSCQFVCAFSSRSFITSKFGESLASFSAPGFAAAACLVRPRPSTLLSAGPTAQRPRPKTKSSCRQRRCLVRSKSAYVAKMTGTGREECIICHPRVFKCAEFGFFCKCNSCSIIRLVLIEFDTC